MEHALSPERENQAIQRDWPEDASHENGKYQNTCVGCGTSFIGHKRRKVCKACAFFRVESLHTETPTPLKPVA